MALGFSTETGVRVGGAVAIGAVLIGGVLLLEHRSPTVEGAPVAAVTVAGGDGDVRNTRPTLDSDGDGYPDWEEELRGTDPLAYTTIEAPTTTPSDTEGYEPPTTLTGRFAEEFLKGMVRANAGGELSAEEKAAFVAGAVEEVVAAAPDELYTRADLRISSASDLATIREYGNTVGSVLIRRNVVSDSELAILDRALTANNPTLLDDLLPLADAYGGMVNDLLTLSAPAPLAKEHLDLVNTLAIIETDIRAMRVVFDDPIYALVRIQRYQDDAAGLFYALDNLRVALEARNVAYTSEESGLALFSLRP